MMNFLQAKNWKCFQSNQNVFFFPIQRGLPEAGHRDAEGDVRPPAARGRPRRGRHAERRTLEGNRTRHHADQGEELRLRQGKEKFKAISLDWN